MLRERHQNDGVAHRDAVLARPGLHAARDAKPRDTVANFKWEPSYRSHRKEEVAGRTLCRKGLNTMCQNHCALPLSPKRRFKRSLLDHPKDKP
jgi:hypothetical protein